MTFVTLKVLEGMGLGVVYSKLPLPVTIGRESDSDVQLNDDRVSRAHAKLQDHSGRVILTDLGSTNGTRVNGHPIQMRVMQHGDVILIGRCVLVFQQVASDEPPTEIERGPRPLTADDDSGLDFEYVGGEPAMGVEPGVFFPQGRPPLPSSLTTLQRAELSDLLSYVHEQVGVIVKAAVEDLHGSQGRSLRCDWETWNRLTDLQSILASDIRAINNPEDA